MDVCARGRMYVMYHRLRKVYWQAPKLQAARLPEPLQDTAGARDTVLEACQPLAWTLGPARRSRGVQSPMHWNQLAAPRELHRGLCHTSEQQPDVNHSIAFASTPSSI